MERHHQSGRPFIRRQGRAKRLRGGAKNIEGVIRGLPQFWSAVRGHSGFKHRGVKGWLLTRKSKIGTSEIFQRAHRGRFSLVPGLLQPLGEFFEAKPCDIRHQVVAVAEMPVGRGRANAGKARRIGDREACRAFLGYKLEHAENERFAQVSMMVAAPASWPTAIFRPTHVMNLYMTLSCAARFIALRGMGLSSITCFTGHDRAANMRLRR